MDLLLRRASATGAFSEHNILEPKSAFAICTEI